MRTIEQILIDRDSMTKKEARDLISKAKDQLEVYLEQGDLILADQICEEYFGLEPDYIMELL